MGELSRAERDGAQLEVGRLEGELRAARGALDAAETERSAAIDAVAAAEDEVRACTGPSWRAVRNLVAGRYRSSRDAAREVAAQAQSRSSAADDTVQARRLSVDRLQAGLAAAVERARSAHDEWEAERTSDVLRAGGPAADELQEIDASLAAREAEQRELREATAAVQSARAAARRALEKLDSASSWGTYDTWFGGDIISSSIKHSRIDDARATMNAVQTQLAAARRELADVGMDTSAPDLARVSEGRTLDIWFDNFFSDLSSQSRIGEGRTKVQQLVRELDAAAGRLRDRTREVAATVAALRARRTAILELA